MYYCVMHGAVKYGSKGQHVQDSNLCSVNLESNGQAIAMQHSTCNSRYIGWDLY